MELRTFLGLAHIIGVALGLGGATVSDIFFIRILKNKKISQFEFQNIRVLSRIVWVGIIILILSGLGFLWLQYSNVGSIPILQSARFLAKLTLVGIVFANGLVFHFHVFPHLKKMVGKTNQLKKRVWLFAITGAISATTWYSIVILAGWRSLDLPYWGYIGIYGLLVLGGVLTARWLIGRLLK